MSLAIIKTAPAKFLSPPTAMAVVAAIITAAALTPVLARDLLFLGITDVRGEPAQPELESELRAGLAALGGFRLIGEVETERVVREMERLGHTRAEAVIPAGAGVADSTVIVRGVVKELSIGAKRSWLLWGKIDARMRLEVFFREVSGQLRHRGEFSAAASKRKESVYFRDPKQVVHVSVRDREELLGQMRASIVKDAVGLAETVFDALSVGGALPTAKAPADSADTAAAAGREFSSVDGKDVAPIDSAGAADSGR
ncbi:MAG: hypothetical protein LBB74_04180 [Chitinispirillales bacterium]|jgi:hypothetical protein|nr:hypothetical protein [Chitinispirillales bacterium]